MTAASATAGSLVRLAALSRLRAQLAASHKHSAGVLPTGWLRVDDALPEAGLARGAVHEWIGVMNGCCERRHGWQPPLQVLAHLMRQAHAAASAKRIVWIGSAVWPYPVALAQRGATLLDCSLFIRARSAAERLSAAALVLRSRAAAGVVVDGSGFSMTATRQLQLAAEAGAAVCLLARPPWERECLSAARTRWLVRAAAAPPHAPQRWIVELLRCKGVQPICSEALMLWRLERRHATGDVVMASDLGDGCDAAQIARGGQRT